MDLATKFLNCLSAVGVDSMEELIPEWMDNIVFIDDTDCEWLRGTELPPNVRDLANQTAPTLIFFADASACIFGGDPHTGLTHTSRIPPENVAKPHVMALLCGISGKAREFFMQVFEGTVSEQV